jgi:hypothetical protein
MRWTFLAFALFFVGCANGESDAQRCERVRDRLVELRLANAVEVDRDGLRKTMRDALGDDFIARCREQMTAKQRSCVLDAADLPTATGCTRN